MPLQTTLTESFLGRVALQIYGVLLAIQKTCFSVTMQSYFFWSFSFYLFAAIWCFIAMPTLKLRLCQDYPPEILGCKNCTDHILTCGKPDCYKESFIKASQMYGKDYVSLSLTYEPEEIKDNLKKYIGNAIQDTDCNFAIQTMVTVPQLVAAVQPVVGVTDGSVQISVDCGVTLCHNMLAIFKPLPEGGALSYETIEPQCGLFSADASWTTNEAIAIYTLCQGFFGVQNAPVLAENIYQRVIEGKNSCAKRSLLMAQGTLPGATTNPFANIISFIHAGEGTDDRMVLAICQEVISGQSSVIKMVDKMRKEKHDNGVTHDFKANCGRYLCQALYFSANDATAKAACTFQSTSSTPDAITDIDPDLITFPPSPPAPPCGGPDTYECMDIPQFCDDQTGGAVTESQFRTILNDFQTAWTTNNVPRRGLRGRSLLEDDSLDELDDVVDAHPILSDHDMEEIKKFHSANDYYNNVQQQSVNKNSNNIALPGNQSPVKNSDNLELKNVKHNDNIFGTMTQTVTNNSAKSQSQTESLKSDPHSLSKILNHLSHSVASQLANSVAISMRNHENKEVRGEARNTIDGLFKDGYIVAPMKLVNEHRFDINNNYNGKDYQDDSDSDDVKEKVVILEDLLPSILMVIGSQQGKTAKSESDTSENNSNIQNLRLKKHQLAHYLIEEAQNTFGQLWESRRKYQFYPGVIDSCQGGSASDAKAVSLASDSESSSKPGCNKQKDTTAAATIPESRETQILNHYKKIEDNFLYETLPAPAVWMSDLLFERNNGLIRKFIDNVLKPTVDQVSSQTSTIMSRTFVTDQNIGGQDIDEVLNSYNDVDTFADDPVQYDPHGPRISTDIAVRQSSESDKLSQTNTKSETESKPDSKTTASKEQPVSVPSSSTATASETTAVSTVTKNNPQQIQSNQQQQQSQQFSQNSDVYNVIGMLEPGARPGEGKEQIVAQIVVDKGQKPNLEMFNGQQIYTVQQSQINQPNLPIQQPYQQQQQKQVNRQQQQYRNGISKRNKPLDLNSYWKDSPMRRYWQISPCSCFRYTPMYLYLISPTFDFFDFFINGFYKFKELTINGLVEFGKNFMPETIEEAKQLAGPRMNQNKYSSSGKQLDSSPNSESDSAVSTTVTSRNPMFTPAAYNLITSPIQQQLLTPLKKKVDSIMRTEISESDSDSEVVAAAARRQLQSNDDLPDYDVGDWGDCTCYFVCMPGLSTRKVYCYADNDSCKKPKPENKEGCNCTHCADCQVLLNLLIMGIFYLIQGVVAFIVFLTFVYFNGRAEDEMAGLNCCQKTLGCFAKKFPLGNRLLTVLMFLQLSMLSIQAFSPYTLVEWQKDCKFDELRLTAAVLLSLWSFQLALGILAKIWISIPPYLFVPATRGNGILDKVDKFLRALGP